MKSRAERERNKIREKQEMHDTIAHYLLNNTQPLSLVPEPQSSLSSESSPPSLYTGLVVLWYGILLWPVLVTCPGYGPSQLLVPPAQWQSMGNWKSPCLRVSTTEWPLKHQCVINILLLLNPKLSTKYRLLRRGREQPLSQAKQGLMIELSDPWCSGLIFL